MSGRKVSKGKKLMRCEAGTCCVPTVRNGKTGFGAWNVGCLLVRQSGCTVQPCKGDPPTLPQGLGRQFLRDGRQGQNLKFGLRYRDLTGIR